MIKFKNEYLPVSENESVLKEIVAMILGLWFFLFHESIPNRYQNFTTILSNFVTNSRIYYIYKKHKPAATNTELNKFKFNFLNTKIALFPLSLLTSTPNCPLTKKWGQKQF